MSAQVCIVTGTRAEWGLFRPVAKLLAVDPAFELLVVATGAHLAEEFGSTWREIERDGFEIAERVEIPLGSDTEVGTARSAAAALSGMADALRRMRPDLVLLLGDRYETFAAATAAHILRVPIAHMHGGELTLGAVDDAMRHAITKMSLIHFTSAEEYRRRVIQLGEDRARVFTVGATGVDNALHVEPLPRSELEAELDFVFVSPTAVVTYHPATLAGEATLEELRALLEALDRFEGLRVLFTHPNADAYGRAVRREVEAWTASRPERAKSFPSLGTRNYVSALRHADLVAGNSSSGIIEAPSFGIPSVDVGDRQAGRVRATSVLHAEGTADAIAAAISRALDPAFAEGCRDVENPYGDGHAAERIVETLRGLTFPLDVRKGFYDTEGVAP